MLALVPVEPWPTSPHNIPWGFEEINIAWGEWPVSPGKFHLGLSAWGMMCLLPS